MRVGQMTVHLVDDHLVRTALERQKLSLVIEPKIRVDLHFDTTHTGLEGSLDHGSGVECRSLDEDFPLSKFECREPCLILRDIGVTVSGFASRCSVDQCHGDGIVGRVEDDGFECSCVGGRVRVGPLDLCSSVEVLSDRVGSGELIVLPLGFILVSRIPNFLLLLHFLTVILLLRLSMVLGQGLASFRGFRVEVTLAADDGMSLPEGVLGLIRLSGIGRRRRDEGKGRLEAV